MLQYRILFFIQLTLSIYSFLYPLDALSYDKDRNVQIFVKMVQENKPGTVFIKHDYLSFDQENSNGRSYTGSVSDVDIDIYVDHNKNIENVVVSTDYVIHRHVMPYIENIFGEYKDKIFTDDQPQVKIIRALAAMKGVEIKSYDSCTYKYLKNNVIAELTYNTAVKDIDGNLLSDSTTDNTRYAASIKK